MNLPKLNPSITYSLSLVLLLVTLSWTALGQRDWSKRGFERLFPTAWPEWSVSQMKIEESDTSSTQYERMANSGLAIAGKPLVPESARITLTQEFRLGERLINVTIDSEFIAGAMMVLMAHGYTSKDGKVMPLPADQKALRDELLTKVQPVKFKDRLAVRGSIDSKSSILLLAGEDGSVILECNYANCLGNVQSLIEQLNFNDLDSFARSRFIKTK